MADSTRYQFGDFVGDVIGKAAEIGDRWLDSVVEKEFGAEQPARVAEVKGADQVIRAEQQKWPTWIWLVLAGLVGLLLVVAFIRR